MEPGKTRTLEPIHETQSTVTIGRHMPAGYTTLLHQFGLGVPTASLYLVGPMLKDGVRSQHFSITLTDSAHVLSEKRTCYSTLIKVSHPQARAPLTPFESEYPRWNALCTSMAQRKRALVRIVWWSKDEKGLWRKLTVLELKRARGQSIVSKRS